MFKPTAPRPATVTGTIVILRRTSNTKNGNPNYTITLDNGQSYRLVSDSSLAGRINNSDFQDFLHTFTLNGHGRITTAALAQISA
jgi:hypothetical protein